MTVAYFTPRAWVKRVCCVSKISSDCGCQSKEIGVGMEVRLLSVGTRGFFLAASRLAIAASPLNSVAPNEKKTSGTRVYLSRSLRSLVRCRVEHEKIKFISTSGHVIFCLFYKHTTTTTVLTIFRRFPATFRRFAKIFQKLFRKKDERFRTFSEDYRRFTRRDRWSYSNKVIEACHMIFTLSLAQSVIWQKKTLLL